jgi:hypothetical protein
MNVLGSATLVAAERKDVRVLLDFESPADVELLRKGADNTNVVLDVVQDNGVTSGKNCCRVLGKAGGGLSTMTLDGEKLKNWGDFDFFAMDVYTEREEKLLITFELWDKASTNYHTRCTFEDGDEAQRTHVGKNTLMWRISRAARNGKKSGLSWDEMQPQDKIQLNGLKLIKFMFAPFDGGGNTTIWIDNLRLMQEDAVGGSIKIKLPDGAKAFDFGPRAACTPGFTPVGASGPGITGAGVIEAGEKWPDPLTGNGLESPAGPFEFTAELPDGEYWVWISAGKTISEKTRSLPFVLKVGDQTLCDEKVSDAEFYGAKGIFRHLHTQYSQRPNALWLDYVEPVCPEQTVKVKVVGGKLAVKVCNHRLAALIAMPAKDADAFKELAAEIRRQRIKLFYNGLFFDTHPALAKRTGDGAFALWTPASRRAIQPWTAPTDEERATKSLDLKAAQGQRLTSRVCVTTFEELGAGDIEISDLKGPGVIPAAEIRRYHQNYRVEGTGADEMALLPWTKIHFEAGLTWAYWFWLKIPADAKAGTYTGTITFKPEKGGAQSMPVKLEVYPFQLEDIPVSYGLWYGPWEFPSGYDRRKLIREQFVFMHEIGFTATSIGDATITALKGKDSVEVTFDPLMPELAKEVGMGRIPGQTQLGIYALGMARQIARLLGLRPAVDLNPGIEFTKPELKGYYQDAVRKYKAFIEKFGMPVVVHPVDEPREVPNPWNRNLEQTNRYSDWAKEVGVTTFVDPMSDSGGGLDYTTLVDHHDIIAVHAFEGARKLIEKTQAAGKTLYLYNTGRDRLSWGFYNWRMGSKGRWEYSWSNSEGGETTSYPTLEEWYTPFAGKNCLSLRAPYGEFSGGFLFKSAYFDMAEGISDYAYLVTLEKRLAEVGSDNAKSKTVADAREFLGSLKKSIPQFPTIGNMTSADAGALVGSGFNTPAAEMCETWRRKIAEFLIALKN